MNKIKNIIEVLFNKTEPDNPYERPSFHDSFLAIARIWRFRSTCVRTKVGACLVKDNKVLATGYNGNLSGAPHCTGSVSSTQCYKIKKDIDSGSGDEYCSAVHAEQNCILQTSPEQRKDAILYSTHYPCSTCARLIVQSGIKEVHYIVDYPDAVSKQIFDNSDVLLVHHKNVRLEDI